MARGLWPGARKSPETLEAIEKAKCLARGDRVRTSDGRCGTVRNIDITTGSVIVKIDNWKEVPFLATAFTKI